MGRSGRTKFIDLFAGVGGFRIALEKLGHECVWGCEIDKYAKEVYKYHWDEEIAGDVREVDTRTIPDFDFLCAGFPCQAFSIAGKREGFQDTRGTLFFEICRILRDKRPKMVLLENVKGLLSHDNYRTFRIILESLRELGYVGQYQVLNSKNFGVPQNRERVFIVGYLGKGPRPEVFPIGSNDRISKKTNRTEEPRTQTQLSTTVRIGMGTKADNTFIQSRPHGFNKGGKREIPNMRESSIQNELVNGIRRLTPLECERLQGFPDNWTKEGINGSISDTQRYKMMGNAITIPVVEAIARKF